MRKASRAHAFELDDLRLLTPKSEEVRAGSVCLNSRLAAAKWISAMVMLQPRLAAAFSHRSQADLNWVSSRRQRSGSPFEKLRSPGRDLVRMDIELFGQFGQRLLALDSGQSHLHLEGRAVVPAWSLRHVFSCSRQPTPRSGRISTHPGCPDFPSQLCLPPGSEARVEDGEGHEHPDGPFVCYGRDLFLISWKPPGSVAYRVRVDNHHAASACSRTETLCLPSRSPSALRTLSVRTV